VAILSGIVSKAGTGATMAMQKETHNNRISKEILKGHKEIMFNPRIITVSNGRHPEMTGARKEAAVREMIRDMIRDMDGVEGDKGLNHTLLKGLPFGSPFNNVCNELS